MISLSALIGVSARVEVILCLAGGAPAHADSGIPERHWPQPLPVCSPPSTCVPKPPATNCSKLLPNAFLPPSPACNPSCEGILLTIQEGFSNKSTNEQFCRRSPVESAVFGREKGPKKE
jgi:hypothetical protein